MKMLNINFRPVYQPPIENGNKKPIQNYDAANHGVTCMYRKNLQLKSGGHQNGRATAQHGHILSQPVWIVQPPYHHPYNTPNSMVRVTYVHMMNVEQTSNWIRTYGVHRGWPEAALYAMSFGKNSINGEMLKHLNHEILKFDLGMFNDMHRHEMLTVIRQLFPSYNRCKVLSEPITVSALHETGTKGDHRQKTASVSPISGPSNPAEDIPWTVRYQLPDRYEPFGMDLSSVQNKSTNSVNTNSGSEMEVSESKFPHTTIPKSFSVTIKLQQREHTAKYQTKKVHNFEVTE